jgi:hypothetical protein
MTVELGIFDIVLYALLLCAGTALCYKVLHSVAFRQKSNEVMVLDLLEQGKAQEAAHCVDRMQRRRFSKETHALAALVYHEAGRIDQAKEHLAMICKPKNMLFLYLASNATLKTLFDELKKHNE